MLVGCGQGYHGPTETNTLDELSPPYTVRCYNCESLEFLEEAVDSWNSAADTELFIIEDSDENPFVRIDVVEKATHHQEYNEEEDDVVGNTWFWGDGCRIEIEESDQDFINLWTHELGHCLGFKHSLNRRSIMYKYYVEDLYITEEIIEILNDLINGSAWIDGEIYEGTKGRF